MENHLISDPVLFMSGFLLDNRGEYYRLLRRLNRGEGWHDWTMFMFDCVESSSKEAEATISRVASLRSATVERMADRPYYSDELVDLMFSKVYCRIGDLVSTGVCERNTASKYLRSMVSDGFLEAEKVGRTTIFKNTASMKILFDRPFHPVKALLRM